MWILDGSPASAVTGGFLSDLWHAFLVFVSMWLANHASGNTGSKQ